MVIYPLSMTLNAGHAGCQFSGGEYQPTIPSFCVLVSQAGAARHHHDAAGVAPLLGDRRIMII
ncbi:MAG TPA: hypothetical protein GXX34_02245 [Clostridia bacterium]|nr:hypothetical protein [Clostridia bacterium]